MFKKAALAIFPGSIVIDFNVVANGAGGLEQPPCDAQNVTMRAAAPTGQRVDPQRTSRFIHAHVPVSWKAMRRTLSAAFADDGNRFAARQRNDFSRQGAIGQWP